MLISNWLRSCLRPSRSRRAIKRGQDPLRSNVRSEILEDRVLLAADLRHLTAAEAVTFLEPDWTDSIVVSSDPTSSTETSPHTIGTNQFLRSVWRNVGDAATGSYDVLLDFNDGNTITSTRSPLGTAGSGFDGITGVDFAFRNDLFLADDLGFMSAGSYSVTVNLDSNNDVNESDSGAEGNNSKTHNFTIGLPTTFTTLAVPVVDIVTATASDWLSQSDSLAADERDIFKFTLADAAGVFFDIDSRVNGLSSTLNSALGVFNDSGQLIATNNDGFDFEGFDAFAAADDVDSIGEAVATDSDLRDSSLYLDLAAGDYYVAVRGLDLNSTPGGDVGAYELRMLADTGYTTDVPEFNSNPGASDTLYLDFDGHHGATDLWVNQEGEYFAAPYSQDSDSVRFSPAERLAIRNIFNVTSEDYSPFNINVSTVEPASFANKTGFRHVVTSSNPTIVGQPVGILGVAWLDSYSTDLLGATPDNVAFTFAGNFDDYGAGRSGMAVAAALEIGNTSSHEFGHALGLNHFNSAAGGIAGSADVRPDALLATPDTGLSREIWQSGVDSNGIDRDHATVIADIPTNSFGYRTDDHGGSTATATVLLPASSTAYSTTGIIEDISDLQDEPSGLGDRDYFEFYASGLTTITVDVDEYVNNLDAKLFIYNSAGDEIHTDAPADSFDAKVSSVTLPAGNYFAEVRSDGDVGESGQYRLDIVTGATSTATLSISDATQVEGDGVGTTAFQFDVTLSGTVAGGFDVGFVTVGDTAVEGVDFTGVSGSRTFTGTDTETKTITVQVAKESITEFDEQFLVELTSLSVAGIGFASDNRFGTGTIQNDDGAQLSISNVTKNEGDASTTQFDFVITLHGAVAGGFDVDWATADGTATVANSDYTADSDTQHFNGTVGENYTISIDVTGDTDAEVDEAFNVALSNLTSSFVGFVDGVSSATGTIVDDELATISVDDVTMEEGDSGTTQFTFALTLSDAVPGGVTIGYKTSESTAIDDDPASTTNPDFEAVTDSKVFTGTAGEQQTVTINVNGDTVMEFDDSLDDEAFFLNLISISNPAVHIGDGQGKGTIINDDAGVAISTFDQPVTATEGGANGLYIVRLGTTPTDDVTVSISPDGELSVNQTTLVFTPQNADDFQIVQVTAVDDSDVEGDHTGTITHTISGTVVDTNYPVALAIDSVTVDITDNDTELSIAEASVGSADNPEGDSGLTAFTFTITRTGITTGESTIKYTVSGAATNPATADDFENDVFATDTVTFAAGETEHTITINVQGDHVEENDEEFVVTLSDETGATLGTSTASGFIRNDDTQSLVVSSTSVTVNEGGTNTFTVALSAEPAGTVTVDLTKTGGDSDLTISGVSQLTFNAGNWSTPQTFTLAAADDPDTADGSATFDVTSAGLGTVTVTATENDDDTQSLVVSSTSVTVNENGTNTFTVALSAEPAGTVTVDLTKTGGDSDLTISGVSQLTFNAGNWSTPQTFTLAAADDPDTADGSATFDVTSAGLGTVTVTATENDDDTQSLVVSSTSVTVNENGTNTFTVALSAEPAGTVTVDLTKTGGDSDLTISGVSQLTFNAGNWSTPQTFTLAAAQDADFADDSATFDVTSAGLGTVTVTATENDDDTQSLVVSSTSVTVNEGGTNTFTVALNAEPAGTVTVDLTKTGGDSDLTISGVSQLSFNAGNWSTPQTFTLAAAQDADFADDSATFDVTSAGLGTVTVTATENDDDTQSLVVSSTSVTVNEGGTNTFTVALNAEPAGTVTVDLTKTGGDSDLTISGVSQLSFNAGNWSTPQTFTLAAADDPDTADGSATFDVTSAGLGTVTVTATENDDDTQSLVVSSTSVTVNENGTNTFTVALSAEPAGTVTVDLTKTGGDSDLTISGVSQLTFNAGNWSTPQTFTLAAADDPDTADGSATFDVTSAGLGTVTVTATENDDDTQSLVVSSTSVTVNENGTNTFTVALSAEPAGTVTVDLTKTGGDSDLTISGVSQLTFNAGNWSTPQTFTLAAADDPDTADGSATFDVTSAGLGTVTVTATENDDDTQSLVVSSTSVTVNENGTNTFTVALSAEPAGTVTVDLTKTGGDSDLTISGVSQLTFNAGNWSTPQTFTLAAAQDADFADDSATFDVTSAGLGTVTVTATENDDDIAVNNIAPVLITSATPTLPSIDENTADPAGTSVSSFIVLSSITDDNVPVSVMFQEGNSSYGGSGYTSGAVTIRQWGGSSFVDTNHNGSGVVIIGFNEPSGNQTSREQLRGLFEFDLEELVTQLGGQEFNVDSANLVLTRSTNGSRSNSGDNHPTMLIEAHAYGFDFDEQFATWDHPSAVSGSNNGSDSTAGGTISTLLSSASFNVTTSVASLPSITLADSTAFRDSVKGSVTSDGVMRLLLKASDAIENESQSSPAAYDAHFARFYAESTGTEANRPKLNLSLSAQKAIAVTGINEDSGGAWEYRLNGVGAWQAVGARSDATALLLGPTDEMRFLPNPNYDGTPTFTFRAWDQTSGTAGDTFNITATGGTSAFSLDSDTASITINDTTVDETSVGPDASSNLLIRDVGTVGTNDTLTVKVDGTNIRVSDPNNKLIAVNGAAQVDDNTVEFPIASITGTTGIIVETLDGDDTLTIDLSGGNLSKAVSYSGGSNVSTNPGDQLIVTGGTTFTTATLEFATANDGTIDINGNSLITYTGLEPIDLTGTDIDNLVLNFTSASAETIDLTDGAAVGDDNSLIDSTAGESLLFATPNVSLTVNTSAAGGAGADVVNVQGLDSLFDVNLTVGADSDDTVNFVTNATSIGSATLTAAAGDIVVDKPISVSGSGAINLTAVRSIDVNSAAHITAVDGNITLLGNSAGTASGNFLAVSVVAADITTSGNGDIVITGVGNGAIADMDGVEIESGAKIRSTGTAATAGSITITGTAGSGIGNDGVRILGSGTIVESQAGSIQIVGASGVDRGIVIANGALIESLGTGANAATIDIQGTGATSSPGIGVAFVAGNVTSEDGDIQIQGTVSGGLRGVYMDTSSSISSIGTTGSAASITVIGTGGMDDSVKLDNSSITSDAGDITITGTADTNGLIGVNLFNTATVEVKTGALSVTGTGGDGGDATQRAGVRLSDSTTGSFLSEGAGTITLTSLAGDIETGGSSVIGGTNAAGNIVLESDTVALGGTIRSSADLVIRPRTASTSIGIGGGAGTLNISDAEITAFFNDFQTITIGDAASGTGTVNVDTATFADDVVIAGGTINDAAVGTDITAPSVTFVGTLAPGQSPGIHSVTGNATIGAGEIFNVEIGGDAAGTANSNHDQLSATGTVTIGAGAVLSLSAFNGYTPVVGHSIKLIERVGGSGTFNGLPEGTVLTDFLGTTGVHAVILYAGGDGDDVVLNVFSNTFVVDTLADTADANPGDGVPEDSSGNTSLRAALEEANALAGAQTIQFDAALTAGGPATITLTSGQLVVNSDLTITGPGSANLAVDGDLTSRVVTVGSIATADISGLTLTRARSFGNGAAVSNAGNLTLTDIAVTDSVGVNIAAINFFSDGGGIFSSGSLTVVDSVISGNTAGRSGGGIYSTGTMVISGTTISGNTGGTGGGVFSSGTTASIDDSLISGNMATSAGGVAVVGATAELTITKSSITNNQATSSGGGVSSGLSSSTIISASTIANNTAANGGGLYVAQFSDVTVINSTISGNSADIGGGGIHNRADLTTINSTVTNNIADADNNSGTEAGGGIESSSGTEILHNTIVSGNFVDGSSVANDISGPIETSLNSLVGDAGSAGGIVDGVGGNLVGTDPLLGVLQDNGGPTHTHMLLPGSPAVDAGSNVLAVDDQSAALTTDQRGAGFARILTGTVDMGAFEQHTVVVGLDGSNNLTIIEAGGGSDDQITLKSTATTITVSTTGGTLAINGIAGGTGHGTGSVTIPLSAITGSSILVDTLGGDDSLTVDFVDGNFAKQIVFDGGNQATSDGLILQGGGSFATAAYNFVDSSSGSIQVAGNSLITYTGLEPITSTINAADVTLNYSATGETLTMTDAGGGQTLVVSTSAETLTFNNPTNSLVISAGDTGNDVININSLAASYPAAIQVNGGTGDDTINVNGAIQMASGNNLTLTADTINVAAALTSAGSGQINLQADRNISVTSAGNVTTANGGITLEANTSGLVTGAFVGIDIDGAAISTTGTGNIALTGRGGDSGSDNYGVHLQSGASVTSTASGASAGTISVMGTGGNGTSSNHGVRIEDATTDIQTVDGDITITGTGGNGSGNSNFGISISEIQLIESAGTGVNAGDIQILGTGGNGASLNKGVELADTPSSPSTVIKSEDGNLIIDGDGGAGSGSSNNGVEIVRISEISTVTGDLTITGDAGNGAFSNKGLFLSSGTGISSSTGAIMLTGTGKAVSGNTQNQGVVITSDSFVVNQTGTITVVGTAGPGDSIGVDIQAAGGRLIADGASPITITATGSGTAADFSAMGDSVIGDGTSVGASNAATGAVTINANSVALGGTLSVRSTGALTIAPRTAATTIGLGSGSGTLNLDASELALLIDGFSGITIGDATSGTGAVDIDTATFTDNVTIVGGSIDVTGLNAAGNTVSLIARTGAITDGAVGTDVTASTATVDGNVTPGQSPGILTVSGAAVIADDSTLTAEFGGTALGNYDQIDASGAVSIGSNVSLSTAAFGGFVPVAGNSFTIIDRTGGSGTFQGLAEGATLTNFLGSGLDATITYAGGTGDDVVITVNAPSDTTAPQVLDVLVGSTGWTDVLSPAFIDLIDGPADSGLGISLAGADQLKTLSWVNLNQIHIVFSEDVSATFTAANLALAGVTISDYEPFAGLSYNSTTNVGTISLSADIAADKLRLFVLDSLTDAAGNSLDGEWTDAVSTTSGNGTAGGHFLFQINVLPGETGSDANNVILGNDVTTVRDAQFKFAGGVGYNPFHDLDGSGVVLGNDVTAVRDLQFTFLPFTNPPTTPPGGFGEEIGGDGFGGDSVDGSTASLVLASDTVAVSELAVDVESESGMASTAESRSSATKVEFSTPDSGLPQQYVDEAFMESDEQSDSLLSGLLSPMFVEGENGESDDASVVHSSADSSDRRQEKGRRGPLRTIRQKIQQMSREMFSRAQ